MQYVTDFWTRPLCKTIKWQWIKTSEMGGMRTHFVIRWTSVEILEGGDDVLAEARTKEIFLLPELMPRLSHNGVNDIQPRDFVFWLALQGSREIPTI